VTLGGKRPIVRMARVGVLFLALVILLVWAFPGHRRPFDYMVAGTFATAITLTAVFVVFVKRRF
jgi:hypothetical protein